MVINYIDHGHYLQRSWSLPALIIKDAGCIGEGRRQRQCRISRLMITLNGPRHLNYGNQGASLPTQMIDGTHVQSVK